MNVRLKVDPDRANLSGITNLDIALSSAAAESGLPVSTYREADKQIPIAVRLRMEERAGLSDIQNAYVYSLTSNQRVPLRQVSNVTTEMAVSKIKRRNQFRMVPFRVPDSGVLPSQVLTPLLPKIKEFQRNLPPGYFLEIGGEYDEQQKGFKELSVVMAISVLLIYIALVVQFRSAVKPLLVFAAIPYGMTDSRGSRRYGSAVRIHGIPGSRKPSGRDRQPRHRSLRLHRRSPRERGAFTRSSARCRHRAIAPVMITVGATVLGLIPWPFTGDPSGNLSVTPRLVALRSQRL